MLITQFKHTSVLGSFYVPCEIIGEDEDGCLRIRYFDPLLERPVEEDVDARLVRHSRADVSARYLRDVAHQATRKFKDDRITVDDEQLVSLENYLNSCLQEYFDYPD